MKAYFKESKALDLLKNLEELFLFKILKFYEGLIFKI